MEKNSPFEKNLQERRQECIEQIDFLLNGFSNEIPNEILDGSIESQQLYKVRGNWFAGVMINIDRAFHLKLVSKDLKNQTHDFMSEYRKRHTGDETRTTKEEIDGADSLLKKAKDELCEGK